MHVFSSYILGKYQVCKNTSTLVVYSVPIHLHFHCCSWLVYIKMSKIHDMALISRFFNWLT